MLLIEPKTMVFYTPKGGKPEQKLTRSDNLPPLTESPQHTVRENEHDTSEHALPAATDMQRHDLPRIPPELATSTVTHCVPTKSATQQGQSGLLMAAFSLGLTGAVFSVLAHVLVDHAATAVAIALACCS